MKADGGKFEWGTTITKAYLPLETREFFNEGLGLMDWLRQFVPPHVTDADELHSCVDFSGRCYSAAMIS